MTSRNSKKSQHFFHSEYERLCFLQDIVPLSSVKANLKENFIDICVDKIRANEWNAIWDSLKVNNSLRYIALRSYWSVGNADEKKKKTSNKKITPPIRSREMTLRLAKAIKDCLTVSDCLECLLFQNIPFREQDIRLIGKGISRSISLKYISLEDCAIGDEQLGLLTPSLKASKSLLSVNFSGCNLTWKSAEQFSIIIKYQASQRHGEAWQDSLRYRRPDLDRMHGLRRITLCDNMICDEGARIIADAIKDDLWLKALDLQNCSISTDGAVILKECLSLNRSLWVLDLRRNQLLPYDLLRAVIEQVMVNASGEHAEYPWISSKETKEKLKGKKVSAKKIKSKKVKRRESIESNSKAAQSKTVHYSKSVHYPWRTEERIKLNRFKSKNPLEPSNNLSPSKSPEQKHVEPIIQKEQQCTYKIINESDKDVNKEIYVDVIKKLKVEVFFYKQKYNSEKELRKISDEKNATLEAEKEALVEELSSLKFIPSKEEKSQPLKFPDLKKCDIEDEQVLDGIEDSFKKFQTFLDMLEKLGLGDLYSQMQQQNDTS